MTDLAIIGAGPAGMAAAIAARGLGLAVTVIDENPAPGGQVFRAVERAAGDAALGADYAGGARLVAAFRASGAVYRPATTLWHADPEDGVLSLLSAGRSTELAAKRILLATGAQERPVPIPGWTLPGVMTAGAAQIMLKTTGAVPSGRVVLAGQGPLLWLLAAQLRAAGAPPSLVLETRPPGRVGAAFRAGGLWRGRAQLLKGMSLLRACRGLTIQRQVTGLRAEGEGRLQQITWDGGSAACDTLLLHEGVVPQTHVSLALGLAHRWNAVSRCWQPERDAWGASSHGRVAIAGDGAGIGGWEAAAAAGSLAGLDAAHRLGRITAPERDRRAVLYRGMLGRALALRPFLDILYAPPGWLAAPPDETLVCRCEEVTAGQVRAAARLGATGPNQLKAYLRCGMGPCQGRLCGLPVTELIAATRGQPPAATGAYRPRAPYKPLTVGELARGG